MSHLARARNIRIATMTGVAVATTLFGTAAHAATPTQSSPRQVPAVFVQTDNTAGNSVVAYRRSGDGRLHETGTYPTGGLGGVLDGSVVDHTASQGSLVYDHAAGLVYAVNAGSNTITVFGVAGDRLTGRQVVPSGGEFPVSVAVHGRIVYVLNARDGGSIQGYRRVGAKLVRVPRWHRGLGLDPNQTPEFTNTPGQIAFTPDGSKLVVTTKANGNSIDIFAVDELRGPSATPVTTALAGDVPFAVAFDPHGHLVATLTGTNTLATFRINTDRTLTPLSSQATGQAATCWVAANGNLFYASNAGSASISTFRANATGSLTALGDTATDPGTVDAAVSGDGRFLYVQTGANGIVDEFRIHPDGTLRALGSVRVPDAAGGEGIVAS